jgi:beta-galactosidase
VEITDAEGLRNGRADNELQFSVEGAGTLAGVGSGDPVSHESFQGPKRKAFRGRCQVVIRTARQPGAIKLKAESPGLAGAELTVESK